MATRGPGDVEESPSDTPNYDRLRLDPSPMAQFALRMSEDSEGPEEFERAATHHYNRVLGADGNWMASHVWLGLWRWVLDLASS